VVNVADWPGSMAGTTSVTTGWPKILPPLSVWYRARVVVGEVEVPRLFTML
jgi:hypothetical protein